MKPYKFLLTILAVLLLFASCGQKENNITYNQDLTIEETVSVVFSSLANGETTQANYYLQEINSSKNGVIVKGNRLFGDNLSDEDKSFIKQRYHSLSYENITIISEEEESSAIINLDINLNDVTSNINLSLDKSNGYWKIIMDKTFLAKLNDFPFDLSSLFDNK